MRLFLICDSRRPRRLPFVSVIVLDDKTGVGRRMRGELLLVYDGEAIIETKHGTFRGDADTMRVLKLRIP
jgi:hypothetical protein